MITAQIQWDEIFQAHERFLWGLLYRLTGNAADADDLVQETFVRAMKTPPPDTSEPWRPWLVRVAINLGRDLLRRRRRQNYEGIWLPSPVEIAQQSTDENAPPAYEPVDEQGNQATRYDMLESVSFAFLLALEVLTPAQRAVLLLRDVFDYSVRETADALAMSEANVKTTLLRARRAMNAYDRTREDRLPAFHERAQQTLQKFLWCLQQNDVAGVESLLAKQVVAQGDGGSEFFAARVPVCGAAKVGLFYRNVAKYFEPGSVTVEMRWLNGTAAVLMNSQPTREGFAPRVAMLLDVNSSGQIEVLYSVMATRKLSRLKFSERPLPQLET